MENHWDAWSRTADAVSEAGWYPILFCFEVEEGFIASAAQWCPDQGWSKELPWTIRSKYVNIGPRFDSKHDAQKWADDHDPEDI